MVAKKKGGGSTPATRALSELGIVYTLHEFQHRAGETDFGGEAALQLGIPGERIFKTLLAQVDGALSVGVVPVSGKLDLKALAAALGGKKATMADPALAERRTGYVVGGISPLGQRSRLPTVVDVSARDFETVFVSGGRRGLDVELSADDLASATGALFAPIAKS